MIGKLKVLVKEIKRRIESGEKKEAVLANYLLTNEERQLLLDELKKYK